MQVIEKLFSEMAVIRVGIGPRLAFLTECVYVIPGLWLYVPRRCRQIFWCGVRLCDDWGMFAGHEESAGDLVERDGKKFKTYYGMASSTAMAMHADPASYR